MPRCNKESCELSDHAGPFKLQKAFKEGTVAYQCQACGNTIIKELPKPKPERPGRKQN